MSGFGSSTTTGGSPDAGAPTLPGLGSLPPLQQAPNLTPPSGLNQYMWNGSTTAGVQGSVGATQSQQQGSQTGNQTNTNVYNPASAALQGQGANSLAATLQSGNLPGNFANNQQAYNAYNSNFQRFVAPEMAAQYGAGSPSISSQEALGMEQLTAQLNQQDWQNYENLFGAVGNFSFTPTGQTIANQGTQQSSGSGTSQNAGAQYQETVDMAALLPSLIKGLTGSGNSGSTPPSGGSGPIGGGTGGGQTPTI